MYQASQAGTWRATLAGMSRRRFHSSHDPRAGAALLAWAASSAIKAWVPSELQPVAGQAVLMGTEILRKLAARGERQAIDESKAGGERGGPVGRR